MREIKFRAWDEERKEMIYQDKHTSFQIADGFVGIDCDETKEYECREWSWNGSLNCILMQFTGLKDKNGKEIYEGDIVKGNVNSIVEYSEDRGMFILDYKGMGYINFMDIDEGVEVIGNIYENPKLLEQTAQKRKEDNYGKNEM